FSNEDDSLNFEDVFIAVPNKNWGKGIIRQLEALQIKTSDVITRQSLGGDPRKLSSSHNMRVYSALNLVAHPRDIVAWRSWCGFGDHLTNSIAWARLEVYAKERGIDVVDALEEIALGNDKSITDIVTLTERFKSGSEIIGRCEGKRGFSLLGLLAETGKDFPQEIEKLIGRIEGDEDARELYERASAQLLDPVFQKKGSVRVGSYESMCGLEARLVIMAGTIDGFIPSRSAFDSSVVAQKREIVKGEERRLFYSALTKAVDELIISYFQKEDLELAESLKMEVRRVRAEHGKRVALVSPSCYIDEMGDTIPGPLSGDCIDS
ncbi:MAG: ATP-dependent helicase, partial [Actinobacteria bacterium]|nr:ATP-dependent helicase [Actinomycetota bacterium]